MKKFFKFALCLLALAQFAVADFTQNMKVKESLNLLNNFGEKKAHTVKFENVKGIAILPNVTKGGLIFTTHKGNGIFVAKNDDNEWSAPLFIDFQGGGIGLQGGYQSTDIILLFKSSASYAGLLNGKGTIDLTAEATILGAGEKAGILTDLPEISAWVLERGDSNGLFLGVSVNTSMITVNNQDTQDYYGRIYDYEDIYNNSPKDSQYTRVLKEVIAKYFK